VRRNKPILFVGGGRITSALCAGLRLGKYSREIVVYDRNPDKLRALRTESRVTIAQDLQKALPGAEILILAVRPASVPGVLQEIAGTGTWPRLCVSLAAGIPLAALRRSLGNPAHWVRAMPSPVSRIGRGLTAVSFDATVLTTERARVRELFETVGQVIEVPERSFDAFTATYSSSHGYHALATLASAAQRAGLDPKTALTAAAHALADGIHYCRESALSVDQLLREAVTPGGIAAASMAAMDKAGYRQAVEKGIKAGISQARSNAVSLKTRKTTPAST
jgi:pyrroline-5-carboxylate reductase